MKPPPNKPKFSVGDLVAVYGSSQCAEVKISGRAIGKIHGTIEDEPFLYNVAVKGYEHNCYNTFHGKQLRRLKKKKPKYYWVCPDDLLFERPNTPCLVEDHKKHKPIKVKVVKSDE